MSQYNVVGNVVFQTREGWGTSRQVPQFQVEATSFEEAAHLARRVMLASAEPGQRAEAHFGLVEVETFEYAASERFEEN